MKKEKLAALSLHMRGLLGHPAGVPPSNHSRSIGNRIYMEAPPLDNPRHSRYISYQRAAASICLELLLDLQMSVGRFHITA